MRKDIDYSKRYWVLELAWYYPSGGLSDVRSTHDSEPIAKIVYQKRRNESGNVGRDFCLWDNHEFKVIIEEEGI